MASLDKGCGSIKPSKTVLVAPRIARLLRDEILQRQEGAFLGSEDELLARYAISRPTLRQIARMLEHEQLLQVRRGVGGGYYARRPTMESVWRTASTYLRIRKTTVEDLLEASKACLGPLVRAATLCEDKALRAELRAHVEVFEDVDALSVADFLLCETRAMQTIARMADNPPLELLLGVLYQIGLEESRRRVYNDQPARRAAWGALRCKIIYAILDHDQEIADVYQDRGAILMAQWLEEDLAAGADR